MRRRGRSTGQARVSAPGCRSAALGVVTVILLTAVSALGWPRSAPIPALSPTRHIIALAPTTAYWPVRGWLERPVNFGFRCTLVDAAAVLDYYGANTTQLGLAMKLSGNTAYSPHSGLPWWVYVALPGRRPLLDIAIEHVAVAAGITVSAHTELGLNMVEAAQAIAHDEPVILNVARTPDGTINHSLLAIGYDMHPGNAQLLVLDPNTQALHWIGPGSLWSTTITSTFIIPTITPGPLREGIAPI